MTLHRWCPRCGVDLTQEDSLILDSPEFDPGEEPGYTYRLDEHGALLYDEPCDLEMLARARVEWEVAEPLLCRSCGSPPAERQPVS